MNTVLFACIHNAGRSQMAAAWFNVLADPAVARAVSAGTAPGSRVHPEVMSAMAEVGIDLSNVRPKLLQDELGSSSPTILITMGCGEACPTIAADVERDDWPLDDPKNRPIEEVRRIRDEIRERVRTLVRARGWERKKV